MISFIKLLKEQEESRGKKRSGKANFKSCSIKFVLKVDKKINRTHLIERIRAIPSVTTVDLRGDDKFKKINKTIGKEYEFTSAIINFLTNRDPSVEVQMIKDRITKSDLNKGIFRIQGVYNAVPRMDTLEVKKIEK